MTGAANGMAKAVADKLTIEHILEAKALLQANTDRPATIDWHIYVNPRRIVAGIEAKPHAINQLADTAQPSPNTKEDQP